MFTTGQFARCPALNEPPGNNFVEKSPSDGVPLENKTIIHTPPLHSKLGCLFLSTGDSHRGKTCNEGVGEGKIYFSLFLVGNMSGQSQIWLSVIFL